MLFVEIINCLIGCWKHGAVLSSWPWKGKVLTWVEVTTIVYQCFYCSLRLVFILGLSFVLPGFGLWFVISFLGSRCGFLYFSFRFQYHRLFSLPFLFSVLFFTAVHSVISITRFCPRSDRLLTFLGVVIHGQSYRMNFYRCSMVLFDEIRRRPSSLRPIQSADIRGSLIKFTKSCWRAFDYGPDDGNAGAVRVPLAHLFSGHMLTRHLFPASTSVAMR